MISLYDDLDAFLNLCQHGIGIAGEFGFANVERSHNNDHTTVEGVVGLTELESVTSCVSSRRSNQLSYEPIQ